MRYIGYATLEKFLARVDSFQTLYLILLEETRMNGVGLGTFRSELLAQASIWNGSEDTIYYWREEVTKLCRNLELFDRFELLERRGEGI